MNTAPNQTLKAAMDFCAGPKLSSLRTLYRRILRTWDSLASFANSQEEVTKITVSEYKRMSESLLADILKLPSKHHSQTIIHTTLFIAEAGKQLVRKSKRQGSNILESELCYSIGDLFLTASDYAYARISKDTVLELRSPATYWHLRGDNALLSEPSINLTSLTKPRPTSESPKEPKPLEGLALTFDIPQRIQNYTHQRTAAATSAPFKWEISYIKPTPCHNHKDNFNRDFGIGGQQLPLHQPNRNKNDQPLQRITSHSTTNLNSAEWLTGGL